MTRTKSGVKRTIADHDDWCLMMSERLSKLNRKTANHLAQSLDAMTSVSVTVADPGDWALHYQLHPCMEGFQVELLPRRKRSKYITNSCSECRLKKRKCSNVRPCAMCIVAGTSARCQAESTTAPCYTTICSAQEALFQETKDQDIALESLRHACIQVGVNIALVRPLWELGLNASIVFRAFRILPLDLKMAMDEAIETAKSTAFTNLSILGEEAAKLHKMQEYGRLSHDLHLDDNQKCSDRSSSGASDWFDLFSSNAHWGHGRWISIEFDKANLAHCRRLKLGDEVAEMLGYHHSEMIFRHSNHEMLLQVSEYEMLITMLEMIFHSFDRQVIWYWRIMLPHLDSGVRKAVYLKCTQHKAFDDLGMQTGYTITFEPSTPQAFQNFKNRYLPHNMRTSFNEKNPDEIITKEAIVYMRKSQTEGAEKLSFLSETVKNWTREH
ncbi:hypothetical protein GUITHDRAFT_110852 [Guillardia theta CCMP2712]|uniref:Zn(2)-C6 fungal-type domain-containing protein n=1 Tax=Guillardia theta (strain CCMP2712) TaxID=905079 RepID=L1J3L8_GUITC|nr:hypothetical protein GUITHDRAFT_110852 [Guillardia theta CCMP2712]EKX43123.1 hypothetical protein GUITHDRAFT_110852 [Guillardia theta CCMP2712]|eukprot:XP_005830103.1 hypothetical protein GUITHDRAFT_110852 [Guillardia theta CCMP2712]